MQRNIAHFFIKPLAACCFALMLAGFCYSLAGCVKGITTEARIKDGRRYGVTEGLFQSRWYHFYERGISFAEGHFWQEAEEDFREALKQRQTDQRRARTYGMHFTTYFPHRELGIVLYYQKRYDEAIHELEISLDSTLSAKAEYYLDKGRKAVILERTSDQGPPEIIVGSPGQNFRSNRLTVKVSGIVRDDTFVKSIQVNGEDVRIDLAESEVEFEVDVPLRNGNNTIIVTAADLAGNSARIQSIVHVDRSGPVISLEKSVLKKIGGVETFIVKGIVHDETGLAGITINGRDILTSATKEFKIAHNVPRSDLQDPLVIKALDAVGNQTVARINSPRHAYTKPRVLLASANRRMPPGVAVAAGMLKEVTTSRDNEAPNITLNIWDESGDPKKNYAVHLSEAFLSGEVEDKKSAYVLRINGGHILEGKPGQIAYFNELVPLNIGLNTYHLEAWDKSDNKSELSMNIERKIQEIRDIGSRAGLVILPFGREGSNDHLSAGIEQTLLKELRNSNRFRMKMNLGVDYQEIADSDEAARIGRRMGVSYVLTGLIEERGDSLEIYANLIDTDSGNIMTSVDVYDENIQKKELRRARKNLSRGLWIKLQDDLPLLEGKVKEVTGKKLRLDFGKARRLKEGMRCILFLEEVVKDTEIGTIRDRHEKELGKCIIRAVENDYYRAEIYESGDVAIEPEHFVITK